MSSQRHQSRRYECAPVARVAFVLLLVATSLGLAACGPINELRDALSQWFNLEKFPGSPGAEELPGPTPMISPDRPLQKETSKPSKEITKPSRAERRPQIAAAPKKPSNFSPTKASELQGTETQSAPPASMRLHTLYPEAPLPWTFSR